MQNDRVDWDDVIQRARSQNAMDRFAAISFAQSAVEKALRPLEIRHDSEPASLFHRIRGVLESGQRYIPQNLRKSIRLRNKMSHEGYTTTVDEAIFALRVYHETWQLLDALGQNRCPETRVQTSKPLAPPRPHTPRAKTAPARPQQRQIAPKRVGRPRAAGRSAIPRRFSRYHLVGKRPYSATEIKVLTGVGYLLWLLAIPLSIKNGMDFYLWANPQGLISILCTAVLGIFVSLLGTYLMMVMGMGLLLVGMIAAVVAALPAALIGGISGGGDGFIVWGQSAWVMATALGMTIYFLKAKGLAFFLPMNFLGAPFGIYDENKSPMRKSKGAVPTQRAA